MSPNGASRMKNLIKNLRRKNMSKTVELARHLEKLHINNMYKTDFYWTWDKTDDEIDAVFTVADALRDLRERNKSTRIFDSGLGISLFRDNSTRTRFSFASACNLPGPGGAGPGREEVPDRPRRDRPRDGQHGVLHGRRHRHPGRYVHPSGPRVPEDVHGRSGRGLPRRHSRAETHARQPAVRC